MDKRPLDAFLGELDLMVRARCAAVYVVTSEERRFEDLAARLAEKQRKRFQIWTRTRGLYEALNDHTPLAETPRYPEPAEVLMYIRRWNGPGIFLLKDFHVFLEDPSLARLLKDVSQDLRNEPKTILISAPSLKLPDELRKEVSVVDLPIPDAVELRELLSTISRTLQERDPHAVDLDASTLDQLVQAARGLTLDEAETAFAKAAVTHGVLSKDDVTLISSEKRQAIRKSGILEFHDADRGLKDIGGLDLLKEWLRRRGKAFGSQAREFGIPSPRGMLLLGVPGCGKSLTARAVAQAWNLPLLHLDLGRVFAGFIGSSEENMRRALATAEGAAPAVLWIDEIEKGLAGGAGNGHSDSGTAVRVFGTLLTWMQERTAPVFVVATANRVDSLPPELLRRGRFDEIFFVDLPAANARKEILAIHLARRGRDPGKFDLDAVASACSGFSGAELEHTVVEGLLSAFDEGRELCDDDLIDAIGDVTPLARTAAETLHRLRSWARDRARPADVTTQAGENA
jgi:SpoVK/Ycf46/Vps4 family AAA+-type ATPase